MRTPCVFAVISLIAIGSSSVFANPKPRHARATTPTPLAEKASINACTAFSQTEKSEGGLALAIRNGCQIPMSCKLSWTLVCAPESKKRKAVHPQTAAFVLADGAEESRDASPSACGVDSWSIENINWSCAPQK